MKRLPISIKAVYYLIMLELSFKRAPFLATRFSQFHRWENIFEKRIWPEI